MLKNYLTIALRHLGKQKGYAFINIAGLAFGIACCLLILLFVQDELSYDRFHEKADQIHRISYSALFSGSEMAAPLTPSAMAPTLAREYPEVLTATRIYRFPILKTMRYEDRRFIEDGIYFVDSAFFDVFSFPLLKGHPKTAFAARDNVVLTESTARRYFGDVDPMNKTMAFGDSIFFNITGVVADAPPNSHFQFDMLVSISSLWERGSFRDNNWFSDIYYTYEVTMLVGLAFVMAAPVAYVAIEAWILQDSAYRITPDAGTFALAGLAGLMIAWLTVSYQSIKAAVVNPVESLWYE